MNRIRTHYDNLKVSRDAPLEVIRAAYKTLTQKYHPDRNPGNPDAARITSLINQSYEVLSDPQKRREHDLWIAANEVRLQKPSAHQQAPSPAAGPSSQPAPQHAQSSSRVVFYLFAGFVSMITLVNFVAPNTATPLLKKPYSANPPVAKVPSLTIKPYVFPEKAPNGQPWPAGPGYVKNYPIDRTEGLSTVTVDNSKSDSDVFVKLISLDGLKAHPIRAFYIPRHGKFTAQNVTPGNYDIRYRDLESGALARSQSFTLSEIKLLNKTRFSEIEFTLYKVKNGNSHSYPLSESEF